MRKAVVASSQSFPSGHWKLIAALVAKTKKVKSKTPMPLIPLAMKKKTLAFLDI
jgi:hypothetical protein